MFAPPPEPQSIWWTIKWRFRRSWSQLTNKRIPVYKRIWRSIESLFIFKLYLDSFYFPIIKRTFSTLVADDLTGVQPMKEKHDGLFYIETFTVKEGKS